MKRLSYLVIAMLLISCLFACAVKRAPDPKLDRDLLSIALAPGNRPEKVEELLDSGADVNARDSYGRTALMKAAQKGKQQIVYILIESGADVNVVAETGETALSNALAGRKHAYKEIVKLLKAAGATK